MALILSSMKSLLTALFITLLISYAGYGQSRSNALSLELGKNGLLYNLTYDHKFPSRFGVRAVVGANRIQWLEALAAGGGGYYLVGKNSRFLELGADLYYLAVNEISDDQVGFLFVHPSRTLRTLYPSANIGYRKYGMRTLFRTGFSPGVIEGAFIPGGYLSLGFLF